MNEDELRAAMRAHDDNAPSAADFRPIVRRDRRIPATIGGIAVVGAVVGVLLTVPGTSHAPLAGPRPTGNPTAPATAGTATTPSLGTTGPTQPPAARSCPHRYGSTKSIFGWLPPGADRTAPHRRLTPKERPDSVIVCAFLRGSSALTGATRITGDLAATSNDLYRARPYRRSDSNCPDYLAATDGDDYLIRLSYGTRTVWVSAPGNHCDTASNGAFRSAENLRADAAQAYEFGTWVTDPSLARLCRPDIPDPKAPRRLAPSPRLLTICQSSAPATPTRVYRYLRPEPDVTRSYNDLVRSDSSDEACHDQAVGPETKLVVRLGYPTGRTAVLSGMRGATYCMRGPGGVSLVGDRAAEMWGYFTHFFTPGL